MAVTGPSGTSGGGRREAEGLTRAEAEAFLHREARLLDERRFPEWLELFTEDGRLFVPAGPSDEPGAEAAVIDDDRATLGDRVQRLGSPATYSQSPPSRTIRLVGNVEVEPDASGPGGAIVHAVVVIHEARLGQVRVLATRCLYRLVPGTPDAAGGAPWRIARKRVRLVDFDHSLTNLAFLL